MADKTITPNLKVVIAGRSAPGVTMWNRLEGRPSAETFERALRAEVRDALWMLTRQWQMGEFRGDDAGSPIAAKVRVETTPLQKYRAAQEVEALSTTIPLETRVEQMPIPFVLGGRAMSLDIRLLMGRYWLKLVAARARRAGRLHQGVSSRGAGSPRPGAHRRRRPCGGPGSHAGGRGPRDGRLKLYAHLKRRTDNGVGRHRHRSPASRRRPTRLESGSWPGSIGCSMHPAQPDAWVPDRLEYQFAARRRKAPIDRRCWPPKNTSTATSTGTTSTSIAHACSSATRRR